MTEKLLVGASEWCELSKLKIPKIEARVDSGAKTSSLHAVNIQPFRKDDKNWVRFEVFPMTENRKIKVRCESEILDRRTIKSSSGNRERRFVIRTTLKLGESEWDIDVTLSNRDSMGYRMLLGREAMDGRIIVDPGGDHLLGKLDNDELASYYSHLKKQEKGLRIGLLASNPALYSNRRLIEAGEQRGHNVHFLNIKHCYIKLDAKLPEVHYRGGKKLNHMDAIIPRIRPNLTFYGCSLIRHFESLGTLCLNGSDAITQSRDKLYSLQLLLKNGVDIPVTGFANSPIETSDLIEMVGGAPLIVKLLEGTQGKGVVLAETRKAAESVVNAFKSLRANLLVQEFIREAEGRDLRCFVINGKVVASMERVAQKGEFRANIHQGGQGRSVKLSPEEKKLAVKAAKIMGLQVAGVDIIRSKKGPLLLEVNSSPGLEGIEMTSGEDVALKMIMAIEKQLNYYPSEG